METLGYADQTWKELIGKFPYARRVQGVKGIFEAHKRCAGRGEMQ